jgi:hypothetical protein
MDEAMRKAEDAGVTVLPSAGDRGAGSRRVAFLRPKEMCGVLFELIEDRGMDGG